MSIVLVAFGTNTRLQAVVSGLRGGTAIGAGKPCVVPLLILTTTGVKSGLPRRQPLVYLRDRHRLIVGRTNFGQTRHPAWTLDLIARPAVTMVVSRRLGGVPLQLSATPVIPERKGVARRQVRVREILHTLPRPLRKAIRDDLEEAVVTVRRRVSLPGVGIHDAAGV